MNTSGEKAPSCPRSGGSPSSEYTAPCSPAPCLPGLPSSELSRRQLDVQLLCACGLDLLCLLSSPSKAIHWDLRKGLPALSPLSSHLFLFLSPSCTVYIQCFSGALFPAGAEQPAPSCFTATADALRWLPALGLGLKAAWALCPSPPHPAVPWLVWMCGRASPSPPFPES